MTHRINQGNQFDVLGDVLETLRFQGTIFFRSMLAAPWGMSLQLTEFPRFHIALSGGFFIGMEEAGKNTVEVGEMDIIMLPTGNAHWIADRPGRKLIPSAEAGRACELGNPCFQSGKITNNLMCGIVNYDTDLAHPLLLHLPEIIHIPSIKPDSPIWHIVELIGEEQNRSGGLNGPITDRLTEVLFLKLIQEYAATADVSSGFFNVLRDRRLLKVLGVIHQQINAAWSIDKLAEEAGMSRATMVRHFRESLGMAPMEYLSQWRLLKSHTMLKYSNESVDRIAERVGYSSAQTLGNAFKRYYGYTPALLRHGLKGVSN